MIEPIERAERIKLRSQYLFDDIFVILYDALHEVCGSHAPICPEIIWREALSFSNTIRTIRYPEWELEDHIEMLEEICDDEFIATLILTCALFKLTPESNVNRAVKDTLVFLLQRLKNDRLYKTVRGLVYKFERQEELQGHAIDIRTYLLKEEERKANDKQEAIENQRVLMEAWTNQAIRNNDDVLYGQIVVMSAVDKEFDYVFTDYVERLREEMASRVEAKKQPAVGNQFNFQPGSTMIKDSSFPYATIAAGIPQKAKQLPMN